MHAFDPKGIQYDRMGVLTDWMSNTSLARYVNVTNCISKYFSNFKVDGIRVSYFYVLFVYSRISQLDGNATINENLADVSGVRWAYRVCALLLYFNLFFYECAKL
jgi:predicted metalloendopeptidase